jgi:excisionase family DNA binding protein
MINEKEYLSTSELAKMLRISRIAVFNKIKTGKIKAVKIGRNFVIHKSDLSGILGEVLTSEQKTEIDNAVSRTAREYGETLRLLGAE